MGVNLSAVNLDGVDPNVALDAIPAGWYNAQIVGSEMKPTKDQTGQYLELTLQILDGEHAGRKLFDRLNLVNSNPTAVEIAYKTLKAIYNAVGVARVNDSAEMHGRPLKVKVKLRPATGEYSATNEVQGYDHIQSAHQPAGVTSTGVPGNATGAPPWAPQGGGAPVGGPAAAPAAAPAQAPQGGAPGSWQPPGQQSQPWQQPGAQAAPAGGPPAFQPPGQQAASPAQVDPMSAARADGWQAHPQHPGYSWRGNDVVADAELMAHYPVQQAPTAPAGGPPAFSPPQGAPAAAVAPAAGQTPPWQAQAPQGGAPAPAGGAPAFANTGGAPAPATAQAGPTPPWAR